MPGGPQSDNVHKRALCDTETDGLAVVASRKPTHLQAIRCVL